MQILGNEDIDRIQEIYGSLLRSEYGQQSTEEAKLSGIEHRLDAEAVAEVEALRKKGVNRRGRRAKLKELRKKNKTLLAECRRLGIDPNDVISTQ